MVFVILIYVNSKNIEISEIIFRGSEVKSVKSDSNLKTYIPINIRQTNHPAGSIPFLPNT